MSDPLVETWLIHDRINRYLLAATAGWLALVILLNQSQRPSLILLDDVMTTGAHLRAAAGFLAERGIRVDDAFVVNLGERGRDRRHDRGYAAPSWPARRAG